MAKAIILFSYLAIEIYLLVALGEAIGPLAVIALIILSILTGVWVLQRVGQNAYIRVMQSLEQGAMPQQTMVDSLLMFIGGILLIVPGICTSVIGLFLLIPHARYLFSHLASQTIEKKYKEAQRTGHSSFFFTTYTIGSNTGSEHHSADNITDVQYEQHSNHTSSGNLNNHIIIDCESTPVDSEEGKQTPPPDNGRK